LLFNHTVIYSTSNTTYIGNQYKNIGLIAEVLGGHDSSLQQDTTVLYDRTRQFFTTGHDSSLRQGTTVLYDRTRQFFTTGHDSSLRQDTTVLYDRTRQFLTTGHDSSLRQDTTVHCLVAGSYHLFSVCTSVLGNKGETTR